MNRISILLIICFISLSCQRYTAHNNVIYSQSVNDSFEIYISIPPTYDSNKSYDVIYYCDANLKSGKLLRELIKKKEYAAKVNSIIFVGIGHKGDYHVLRRRDFILPQIENGDTLAASVNYGQVEKFYQFLKSELIPSINSTYNTNSNNNSIVGHSLSGLFVFYCLFKNDSLFTNYYALSPSLWVDYYSIYKFNKLKSGIASPKNLYFSTGSLELLNRIKSGTDQMEEFLETEAYKNLTFMYEVHKGETHNSQVEYSLKYILQQK